MKTKIIITLSAMCLVPTAGTVKSQPDNDYKAPDSYQFDYKVVYQVYNEEKNSTENMTYYFTKNDDYVGIVPPPNDKKDVEFIVNTKDGKMITFAEGSSPKSQGQKTITIIDMRHLWKSLGSDASEMPKNMSKKDSSKLNGETNENGLNNFKKTGRTKEVFGYTAEEYTGNVSKEDKDGTKHTGIVSAWYAKVDFDPSMMFSMGMGKMSKPYGRSGMNHSKENNFYGLGLTEKNYLPVEVNYTAEGETSKTPMKAVTVEKTSFSKSTSGYQVRNFGGMGMK